MAKVAYKEGDFIAVPLREGGWAAGRIARVGSGGILLGYFLGQQYDDEPTIASVLRFKSDDAVLIAMFGDLGLLNGSWKVIGASAFKKSEWPVPKFCRRDVVSGKSYLVTYDVSDVSKEIDLKPISIERGVPEDGLFGYGAIELVLTKRLAAAQNR
ncbi:MAG: immunity 26/phosphotriesterase HocA family protein [Terriglobales bacterium]